MKVVIDEKIPYLKEMLSGMGCDVKAMSGSAITGQDVSDAVALFVRTRTKCVQELLDGSVVRFIGTATIGYDHIDTAYCDAKGIEWHNAAGCNAGAVLQYVQSVVYSWARDRQVDVKGLVLGVGAKIFTVAGPVLLYGILSGAIYGVIYYFVLMWT